MRGITVLKKEEEHMKGKMILPLFVLILILFSLKAVSADNKREAKRSYYLPVSMEEIEGTWLSQNDPWKKTEQKLVFYWWGYFETYRFAEDTKPFTRGTSTIVDKWIDDEGAVWYKEFCRIDWNPRTIFFRLIKLSDDLRKWESVQSTIDFPALEDLSADDRQNRGYRVFYRREPAPCCH